MYEEQKRLDKRNPEAGKLFDKMLLKAKQAKKASTSLYGRKPFRNGPGATPGRSRGSGRHNLKNLEKFKSNTD